jgi:DNA-binding MarR family transcriptional regulator
MDPARDRMAKALLDASRALVALAIRTAGEAETPLTVVQHRVLVLLEEAGVLSVNDVARRLGVDQSNASRHCGRLAELGLVSRTRAAHDKRAVDVRLTAAGRGQVVAVRRARLRHLHVVLSQLSDTEARAAVRGVEAFAAAAGSLEAEDPAAVM